MTPHRLFAVKICEDGSHVKAFKAAWEAVFGEKDVSFGGDMFERDKAQWVIPGSGFVATDEQIAALIKIMATFGVVAEDWSGHEIPGNDEIAKHDQKLQEFGVKRIGSYLP